MEMVNNLNFHECHDDYSIPVECLTSYYGTGLWTGVFFAIAGGVGLMTSQRPSNCTVTAFMVFNIIASLFTLPLIVFSGIEMGEFYGTCKFLSGIQLLTGLAQGIVAITTAAFCCRVSCCISSHRQTNVAFTRTVQSPPAPPAYQVKQENNQGEQGPWQRFN